MSNFENVQMPVLPEQHHPLMDRAKVVVATAVVGAIAVFGCSEKGDAKVDVDPKATTTLEATSTTVAKNNFNLASGSLVPKNDAELANGGYNCGHTVPENQPAGHYNYAEQIDYLNEKPDLAKNLIDFQVNDNRWGMGAKAWDVITNKALDNPDTPASKTVNGNKDMNVYTHKLATTTLPESRDYINFTCADADGNVIPVTAVEFMKLTGTVNGFVFDQAGLDEFSKVVRRGPNGEMMFDIIPLGEQKVNKNGKDMMVPTFMVVTESRGCLNPNRTIPPTTKITKPPVTTIPGKTPPTTTYVTTPPTTGVPPKIDNGTVPGPGIGRGTVPTEAPVPDNGEQNPVGGTLPPTRPPQGPSSTEAPGTTTRPTTPNTVPGSTTPPPPVG